MTVTLSQVKSDMLDPDIHKRLPQQSVASTLETESIEEEVPKAMKAMTNAKAVESDDLPVELMKLELRQTRAILMDLQRLITLTWCDGKVAQHCKDVVNPVFIKKNDKKRPMRNLLRHLARVPRWEGASLSFCQVA